MFLELNNVQKMVILKVEACLLSPNCKVLVCVIWNSSRSLLTELNWIKLYLCSDLISPPCPPYPLSKHINELLGSGGRKNLQRSPGSSRNQVVLIGKHHKVVCRVLVYSLRLVKILWDGSIKDGVFFLYVFISLFIIPRVFNWLWNYG